MVRGGISRRSKATIQNPSRHCACRRGISGSPPTDSAPASGGALEQTINSEGRLFVLFDSQVFLYLFEWDPFGFRHHPQYPNKLEHHHGTVKGKNRTGAQQLDENRKGP